LTTPRTPELPKSSDFKHFPNHGKMQTHLNDSGEKSS